MSTRSLTVVLEDDGTEIVTIYRQSDGYPSGHGAELKDFLKDITLVNGLGMGTLKRVANGMPCLAAQIVTHFKGENNWPVTAFKTALQRILDLPALSSSSDARDIAAKALKYTVADGIAGGFYLHPAGTRDVDEEYIYTVYGVTNGRIHLKVESVQGGYADKPRTLVVLYDGDVKRFSPKAAETKEKKLDAALADAK